MFRPSEIGASGGITLKSSTLETMITMKWSTEGPPKPSDIDVDIDGHIQAFSEDRQMRVSSSTRSLCPVFKT